MLLFSVMIVLGSGSVEEEKVVAGDVGARCWAGCFLSSHGFARAGRTARNTGPIWSRCCHFGGII